MDKEQKLFSVEGFDLEENIAAAHLECALSINFSHRPYWVDLNWRNRLVLARKTDILTGLLALRGHWGAYSADHNIFFTDSKSPPLVALHENMHAYLYEKNPQLREGPVEHGVTDYLYGLARAPSADTAKLEEIVVLDSFQEGMCHWAAFTTAISLPAFYKDDAAHNFIHGYMPHFSRPEDQPMTTEEYHTELFDCLTKGISAYQAAFIESGANRKRDIDLAVKSIEDVRNFAGFAFIRDAMDRFQRDGVRLSRGIDMLAHRPPTEVKQLRNGPLYARGLRR